MLAVILLLGAPEVEKGAAVVLASLVQAARENQQLAVPRQGRELSVRLVSAAARAAAKLPEKERAPALLLALGIGLDRSALMRKNPVTAFAWRRIEDDKARAARLAVLGTPTLHGREDLMQHFAVSCALTVVLDAKKAESAGLVKELLDAQPGGSGFSFADLAADYSGVAFAEWLKAKPDRLEGLAAKGDLAAFCVPPRGLEADLGIEEFHHRFGGVKDKRFLEAVAKLRKRIAALPGFNPPASDR